MYRQNTHTYIHTNNYRCTDGHQSTSAKCRGLRRLNVMTHKEETLLPYLITSSQPVCSPDGKYLYLASAANDKYTQSAVADSDYKKRQVTTVPAGMYKLELATGQITFIAPMKIDRLTALTAVISSDGKTLYYNEDHAILSIHLDTGVVSVLCGSRDTFGKANGRAEDARCVTCIRIYVCIRA